MALRRSSLPALTVSLAAVLTLLASLQIGPLAVAALLVVFGAAVLLSRPDLALGAAVAIPMLIEPEPDWGPSSVPSRIYELVPGTKFDPVELLVILALVAVMLDRSAARAALPSLGIMSVPVALLGLALIAGVVTGHFAGTGANGLVNASRNILLLLAMPVIVVKVVGTRVALRTVLGLLFGLAALKGVLGVAALVTGQTANSVGDQALTYYDAPANALTMFAILFCIGARLRRVPLPAWAWAALPFMSASLLLSYRRSFWIATVLGVLLVVLFAVGRSSRRLGIPAVVVVGVAAFLMLSAGVGSGLVPNASGGGGSGVSGRLSSLNPTSLSQSRDDRYRTGERSNVLADLRASPVAGLGLGVEYRQRYPLSISDIPRDYVHFAALWWWMKTGILGLAGYLVMMAVATLAGLRVFSRHPDATVRVAGLAAAAGFAGFAVAETTATFTGADPRSSILLGTLLGLLAVAYREAMRSPVSAGERSTGR